LTNLQARLTICLTSTVVAAKEEVFAVARFRTRHVISYVGALAAATAEGSGAILVIGDPELGQLARQIQIEDLKRKQSTDQR
jgi:predicted nucleic acid-binding protein